jgi:D-alanyl-D-alanine carboxypeptidase
MLKLIATFMLAACAGSAAAQAFSPAEVAQADAIVGATLKATGTPSASIAVVRGDTIVFAKAYGRQSVDDAPPRIDATYPVGSISKQFTAAAVLILADEGKLSLDDPVGKYVSGVTRGERITIRQVLSHTAGIQDYWPQDYAPTFMRTPVTPRQIVDRWAGKALDFEPGSQWQYSNTGYTIAGMIVEKVSGESLQAFRREHIFEPLGMHVPTAESVYAAGFPTPFERHALGPPRPATPLGSGWVFGAGDLAMSASDLALWDVARIDRSVLPRSVWATQETPIELADGANSRYGLGVGIGERKGRRFVEHSGGVIGFTSENIVYPHERAAVVVFVNADFADASGAIAQKISDQILFPARAALRADGDAAGLELARSVYRQLQSGDLDRSRLTSDANAYFAPDALADYRASLGPLGEPASFTQQGSASLRGGLVTRAYVVGYPDRKLQIVVRAEDDAGGKLEQFLVYPDAD